MTIYEKNLEIFGRFCPAFLEEVKQAKPKPPPQLSSVNEPQEWFSMLSLSTAKTLIVFGLGAGEYYSACKTWLAENEKHYLVFLEDDLSRLHHFLTTTEAEEILSDPQVIVAAFHYREGEKNEFDRWDFHLVAQLFADTDCLFTETREYLQHRKDLGKKFRIQVQLEMEAFLNRLQFFDLKNYQIEFTNFIENLYQLDGIKFFDSLIEKFQNIPAIICAAGPSLVEELSLLNKLRDRALIFGAGTGMNVLNFGGVMAHIGIGLDHRSGSRSRILSHFAFETPYFFVLRFHHEAMKLLHGPKMIFKGQKSVGVGWFEEKINKEMDKGIYIGHTTTQTSFGIAIKMGCNPITFLGLDLAYTDQKRYPDAVRPHPLEDHALKREYSQIVQNFSVKSLNKEGNLVQTKIDWIHEANVTGKVAAFYSDIKCINATPKGLAIPNLVDASLESLMETEFKEMYDLDNRLHSEMQLSPELTLDRNTVNSWLEELQQDLSVALGLLDALLIVSESDPSVFPSPNYEGLIETLKKGTVYQYFLKEYDSHFPLWVFRDFFRAQYRSDTLSQEELDASKLLKERYRLLYLKNIVEGELRIIQKGMVRNNQDTEASQDKVVQAPAVTLPPPIGTDDKRQTFFPEGQLKSEAFYEQNQLQGSTSFYSPEGALLARGNFVHGQREGENWQYYKSGELFSIQRYCKGAKEGRQEYYYPSGNLKTEIHFKQGKLDGPLRLYHKNGRLKREMHFKEGLLHGSERMWNAYGQILMELVYEHHHPIGGAKSWDSFGALRKELFFYDSAEHFDQKEWDGTGKLVVNKTYMPQNLQDGLEEKSKQVRNQIADLKAKLGKLQKE